jgi:hypothetical protein
MKLDSNYGVLNNILTDVAHQSNVSPAFALFNRDKIKRFHQLNQYRIERLGKEQDKLVDQYVKKDEEGKPLSQKNEAGKLEYIYETEELKTQHTEAWEKLMKQDVEILL